MAKKRNAHTNGGGTVPDDQTGNVRQKKECDS